MQQQQQSASNRKRPATGMSPLARQPMTSQQPQFQYQPMPDANEYPNFDFNGFPGDQTYADTSLSDPNSYSSALNASQPHTYGSNIGQAPSTDLVRRPHNQELAPSSGGQEQWNSGFDNMPNQDEEDERELEYRVAQAKKEAQGKRKQIPPFVQKLSSFLDNNHTDLIRWSDDGRSFIVLDEDEFARTLIPELFKHNNYASFVRQLNMYGFHKTVNITDGSLRQSEKARKGVKPPSMYSHPYFRKNRPELLWLIQKPTSKTSAKRKREGPKEGYDSDEERQYSPGPDSKPQGELGPAGSAHEVTSMARGELNAVRQEIKKLQQQQSLISRMIGQLKEQNDQFYRQATAFQALHDRHENSINAILTFLATFYNRSLEGHSGQNLVNMFSNSGNQNKQPQQGSVVEEYNDGTTDTNNQVQRYVKRPQLLLTGPNATSPQFQQGNAGTEPNSARASATPPQGMSGQPKRGSSSNVSQRVTAGASATTSPTLKDDAPTPDLLNTVPESDEMLSLINNINATAAPSNASTPAFEYNDALTNLQRANGNPPAPLSTQQANDMISLINQQTGNSALTRQNDNFSSEALRSNNSHIEQLTHLANDNQSRIDDLQARLGPLSPTGSIPGLGSSGYDVTGAPGQYDPNSFTADDLLSYNDYRDDPDMAFLNNDSGDWTDYNYTTGGYDNSGEDMFGADESGGAANKDDLAPEAATGRGGTIESLSSESTSPAHAADDGDGLEHDPGTPNKRQKRT